METAKQTGRVHHLKSIKTYREELRQNKRQAEIRNNDRDFQVGDVVRFYEFIPQSTHQGQWFIERRITHVSAPLDQIGLPGYVILTLIDPTVEKSDSEKLDKAVEALISKDAIICGLNDQIAALKSDQEESTAVITDLKRVVMAQSAQLSRIDNLQELARRQLLALKHMLRATIETLD